MTKNEKIIEMKKKNEEKCKCRKMKKWKNDKNEKTSK